MNYEQRLRAIGRLIDQAKMHDLCILEFDKGVAITGFGQVDGRDGRLTIEPKSVEFANSLIEQTASDLNTPEPKRRGLFGRA